MGLPEVDRVLGGGLVPGEVLLLGGEPGIGKSTLVLQVAAAVGDVAREGSGAPTYGVADDAGRPSVLYATAEESASQLHLRAARLGLLEPAPGPDLVFMAATSVDAIIDAAARVSPALLVVDSIQTVDVEDLDGPPGSVGQVREAAARFGAFARRHSVPVMLVGHVTKDGSLAGPRTLEHLVDAVLMLEGDRYGSLRLLRSLKNRYGSTEEIGVLEMGAAGLREVADAASAFLGHGSRDAPGLAVAAVLEGSRPLLVEVQALVAPAGSGPPRRTVAGIDASRLALLVAVLARRAGVDVSGRDVYASLTGGVSVSEPALDLAVALAIASSQRDRPIRRDSLVFGEVSLLGDIRTVPGVERRLREAERLGFRRAIIPAENQAAPEIQAAPSGHQDGDHRAPGHARSRLERIAVRTLREALELGLEPETGTLG
ncbi:hypothetical protein BH24CHL9_BH24CHL9_04990 [soil metagenome]